MASSKRTTSEERRDQARSAQAGELAKAKRERDSARAELAKANRRAVAQERALARGITDPVRLTRIANLTETKYEASVRANEEPDVNLAVAQAIHEDKTKHGDPSVAPVEPNGAKPDARPSSFAEVIADRERRRALLRQLGFTPGDDPMVGGGGPFGGGPIVK
jgi:hypothetical protein